MISFGYFFHCARLQVQLMNSTFILTASLHVNLVGHFFFGFLTPLVLDETFGVSRLTLSLPWWLFDVTWQTPSGRVMLRWRIITATLTAPSPVKSQVICGRCSRLFAATLQTLASVSLNRSFDFPANGLYIHHLLWHHNVIIVSDLPSNTVVRSFVLCGQWFSPGRGRELVGVCGVC